MVCKIAVLLKGGLFIGHLCYLYSWWKGKWRRNAVLVLALCLKLGSALTPVWGLLGPRSFQVNKWTENFSSHLWLLMPFVNFLHSSFQLFIIIFYVFTMKQGEMDQFSSIATPVWQNHPENDGERSGDKTRDGMSKCMWEERNEDHFTETQQ